MERIRDRFLDMVEEFVPLRGKKVLEVGCGSGNYSGQIAKRCASITGIDTDITKLKMARCLGIHNARFYQVPAQATKLGSGEHDVTIFTLSLHHIPKPEMPLALDEAARVTKYDGRIVVLEPGVRGSFFEAEIRFDACDGDERAAKAAAKSALRDHPLFEGVRWLGDKTIFKFNDVDDFITSMQPKQNLDQIAKFLWERDYMLTAERHIGLYTIRA